jgi:hypothetical protein
MNAEERRVYAARIVARTDRIHHDDWLHSGPDMPTYSRIVRMQRAGVGRVA